jgi:hypothetical protein
MPIHLDGVLIHAMSGTELSHVRTGLDPFRIFPTLPPHPVQPNGQSSRHSHLGDASCVTAHSHRIAWHEWRVVVEVISLVIVHGRKLCL